MALTKLPVSSFADGILETEKINDGSVTDAKVSTSASINLTKLDGIVNNLSAPTISSLSITQKNPDVATNVTITGSGYVSIPLVTFQNTSTGARVTATTVTFTSSTSLVANFPADQTVGTYKVIVENPDGISVRSSDSIINSAAPTWQTSSPLTSYEEGDTVNETLLAYDDDSTAISSYTLQSGTLPSGVTLSGDSSIGSLTGTAPTVTADTQYSFTIRATDNESQTTDKAFNMTITNYNQESLMFNDGDSAYLNRTNSGAGNRRTFTYSFWMKRTNLGQDQRVIEASTDATGNEVDGFEFQGDTIRIVSYHSSTDIQLVTNQVFRDPSAWYHFVVAFDTTQATASNRVKLYVNGTQVTSFSTETYPSQNYDTYFNNNSDEIYIGRRIDNGGSPSGEYFDGYLGETILVDGQQLAATSFGETDSNGVWIPKKYTGTYGTNGFRLQFKDSSSLGKDTSGNSGNFTANNFATTDQGPDSPHLNYATMNPLASQAGST